MTLRPGCCTALSRDIDLRSVRSDVPSHLIDHILQMSTDLMRDFSRLCSRLFSAVDLSPPCSGLN